MSNIIPGCLTIKYINDELILNEYGCWESRGISSIKLIKEAFRTIDTIEIKKLKQFEDIFFLGDRQDNYEHALCSSNYSDSLIPDWLFDGWPEVGINSYDNICNQMREAGKNQYKKNKLFWIGNKNTHYSRNLLVEMSKNKNDIIAIDCGIWSGINGERKQTSNTFVSLPEHCEYRFLIDLQGSGYSARLKILLHSNRTIFYQKRKWNEYWFFDLMPFVHYIPVEEDLSDLEEKITWANNNTEKCDEIAYNALEFARNNLYKQNAINRYQYIIKKLGKIL
jgi:hypothetical protein